LFDNNPAVIVNNLFKRNPEFETAKYNINFGIINTFLFYLICCLLALRLIKGLFSYNTSFPLNNYENLSMLPIVPIVSYPNADTQKLDIIKDNRKKSGIYCWTNLKNGKFYIGSAVDLSNRLHMYYNINLLEKSNMVINKALLKYGYSNFKLEILEYCDKSVNIEREQHYIDLLKPEYNTLKQQIQINTLEQKYP